MRPFYRSIAGALLVAITITACGGDSSAAPTAPAPSQGAVQFKLDALTCTGSAAIDFYLDGSIIGTETLSPGVASKQYVTSAGLHVLSAAVSNTRSLVWPSTQVTVQANVSNVWLMRCS